MTVQAFAGWTIPAGKASLDLLFEWQDGRCALCGRRGRLVQDHCHDSGLVRGLLCYGCNSREGQGWDTPELVAWRSGVTPARLLGLAVEYVNSTGYVPFRWPQKGASCGCCEVKP